MNVTEFRAKHPQYNDLSDQELADALHAKHYSDIDRAEFDAQFLGATQSAPMPQQGESNPIRGGLEAAGTMASAALAEPVAGLAGIASIPFKGSEAGDIVNRVREILTLQPQTEDGRKALQSVAGFLEPLSKALESAETGLGEAGFELAGPIGGAIGASLPTLAAELLGAKGLKAASKGADAVGDIRKGTVPTADADLIRQGNDAGVPILTSDVRPPSTFAGRSAQQTAEKIPLVGTGPVREGQQQMRVRAVEKVAEKYGEFSYDTIVGSLKNQRDKIKNAAGAVLERTSTQLDEIGDIPLSNARKAIDAAKAELSKPNVIKSSNAAEDLESLIDALDQPQTFTSLKENRTAFREIVNSTDKADRSQLTSRAKSLLDNVYNGITKDMEAAAKANLSPQDFGRWKRANAVYQSEARKLTKSKLKNVLDKGDITPESVKTMLFSQSPSEQALLYKSLTNEGRAHARAAVISKVFGDVGRRRNGVTPNSFATEMKKYESQINTFFKGSEKRELQGLQRVLEATTRAQDAGVTTATGQQLIPLLTGASFVSNPTSTVAAAGTVGGLARLYESAPVRNALLKLGSVPRESKNYGQALLNAQLTLTAALEPSKSEEDE